ncbi:MAG: DUF2958 domain-containing protein [Mesorhizobium sp.]|nr:MAG: DUF2958 domain-containing protein [Mesorhizobium sp.]TGS85195.1 DUF2958 domain-containing protein [Mesorhizobium sp. M3A.F.Ca.ET.175.01.1.1]TGT23183.1 DUF2958 domain-containing protein [Mesorhizobium sp. M3A.F.Ca.ET.174.01.1.1]TIU07501.1 MAG: DUF2958 domain-containing protein [Mesorhizobium sp.]TIW02396.1 MAG: DUF2958 domain-containing protein [Mesorhizobium sp.]
MPLLTADQREQFLANGRQSDRDHVPVVKFFNPVGIRTWLATELDGDIPGVGAMSAPPERRTAS